MTSLDKYDKIYAKYSDAIDGRGQCDPPTFRDPPEQIADSPKDEVSIKVASNAVTYQVPSPEIDVTPLVAKLADQASCKSTHADILSQHQDPEESQLFTASRDDHEVFSTKQVDEEGSNREDNIVVTSTTQSRLDGFNATSTKQVNEEGSNREDNIVVPSTQARLDRFNAQRTSMRSIYGSLSVPSKVLIGSDPPSDDIDARLAYLIEKSLSRRASIFPKCNSSKSDHNREAKTTSAWDAALSNVPHMIPSPSSSLPMKALAMTLISSQINDDYRMSHEKCTDCTYNMLEASNQSGVRKCVFCPINDFRAIVQGAVSNKVMAAKRIQGDHLVVSDGKCEHCFSPTQEGICEVCPILDEVCLEVARAVGRGDVLSHSYCNDCRSQNVESSDGAMHCIVCRVLCAMLGDQQFYKPRKSFAIEATTSLETYQQTYEEAAQLLDNMQLQDNASIQIQLDEELVKAKNAQSLLGSTIENIVHESKTSGIRTELKAELLKAKEAQSALQKLLEKKNDTPNESSTPVEPDEKTVDLSYAISQREIDGGNIKEYIPPPKHFFQRGIPKTISVVKRRGANSVGNSYYTNHLKQSAKDRQYVADVCCIRVHKQSPDDERAEYYDDRSIGTDEYSADISLNSYESRDRCRRPVVHRSDRHKMTRSRRWNFFDLCGGSPSFDSGDGAGLDESDHSYDTNYRSHRKFSFDNDDRYHRARLTSIRRDDDFSHDASMYSNITPRGIMRSTRCRSQSSSFSVMTDDHSRMSHRGHYHQKRFASSDNSASSMSEYRRVSFYNNNHRELEIDKLKTLTEEGDDSLQSQHPNPAVAEVRRVISEYKSLSHEMKVLH